MPVAQETTPVFRFPIRVYYEDTDTAGVVYYANYLKFFERARSEWLRTLGFEQARMADTEGKAFVVRAANTQYRKPARLDDALMIHSRITRVARASLAFSQWCVRDDDLLASGTIEIACVALATLRPTAIPPHIAASLAKLQSGTDHHAAA